MQTHLYAGERSLAASILHERIARELEQLCARCEELKHLLLSGFNKSAAHQAQARPHHLRQTSSAMQPEEAEELHPNVSVSNLD